jgi:glycosyltransferase involved in cell wall biosynthesis
MTAKSQLPLVSIGLPLFNEEHYVDSALNSLQRLDYPNLEIIVSDNASTDRTFEICQRHAADDKRVHVERAGKNMGVTANFQRVLDLAHGRYFTWAGGHDLWAANLLGECVDALETNESACLAFGSCEWIGGSDEVLQKKSGWSDTRGLAPAARLFVVLWGNMNSVMGLMRTDYLRGCGRLPNLVGGDLVLLSQLALRGEFVHARKTTWFRRETRQERHHDDKLRRYSSSEVGIEKGRLGKLFPLMKLPIALIKVVAQSSLPFGQKCSVLLALIPSLLTRYIVGRRGSS